ncbi:hypothetical protein CONLIGDRAFT_225163 [Coniochaeta ligniaria NRRL 30616]|uniref:Uncharacterized protein n=1 Tax=Coniochaeta ligniaria NRRL 30616 TaxID=1408157 RepID=A0A1J7I4E3_9PEZI|nr:hypothetical protein CONLIGDRAFT_225163 [Coniochaeta ligniaria NRRL 30616]
MVQATTPENNYYEPPPVVQPLSPIPRQGLKEGPHCYPRSPSGAQGRRDDTHTSNIPLFIRYQKKVMPSILPKVTTMPTLGKQWVLWCRDAVRTSAPLTKAWCSIIQPNPAPSTSHSGNQACPVAGNCRCSLVPLHVRRGLRAGREDGWEERGVASSSRWTSATACR